MLKNFWLDDNGAIVSIELVLIITVAVLALIVGWSEVAVAVNSELNDISNAVGTLNQTYAYVGFSSQDAGGGKKKNFYAGSTWLDSQDECDANTNCSMVCTAGYSATTTGEASAP